MKRLLILVFLFLSLHSSAQTSTQYFDGVDTIVSSIIVDTTIDTAHAWQIGRPQKKIFRSAATLPYAIVTDTVKPHLLNTTSSFIISTHPLVFGRQLTALRWKQKIDFNRKHAGGIIDYSTDSGKTWQNVFNNTKIYSFYGFNTANKDTLLSGEFAFSGTDTIWRDIWLCFPLPIILTTDSLLVRFTLKSDSVDSSKEGWLIDNFLMHPTFVHTASKILKAIDEISVYPTITSGVVHIDYGSIRKSNPIRNMLLVNAAGKTIRAYTRFEAEVGSIDIGQYPAGTYYLKIDADNKTTVYNIVLQQ